MKPGKKRTVTREIRRNERIRAREVLVIGDDGERLGVLSLVEAQAAARERELDLVEVSPNSVPPVCRILDYGKYKYDQAKREKGTKHQHHGELREVRFKVKISGHDLELKLRRAERFLKEGDKVKLSVMFRGREITHPELGRSLLDRAQEYVGELAIVEKPPTMEGRFMNMILGPGRVRTQQSRPKADAAPAEAPEADAAPAEAPKADATTAEAPKADAAPAEAPKADAAPAEAPKADATPAEAPKADAAPAEAPKADAAPAEAPKADAAPAEAPEEAKAASEG